jgi:CPA2 family monovalent cation:H+ antiporter-2
MTHNLPLISTIAASFGFALAFGFIANKMGLPALVGYLIARILVGPFTLGFVADLNLSVELSEIGVILLMFGVGLHFSINDLLKVKKIALTGAIVQIAVATLLGMLICHVWGWSLGTGLVFGLALSVASTIVLLKALEDKGILQSFNGQIAVGWLVVEDLVMVMVLVLLPALAPTIMGNNDAVIITSNSNNSSELWSTIGITMAKLALFIGLMLVVGKRVFPWILWQISKTNSKELFTLSIICAAVGIAYASAKIFGVSFALGAFFAGMVLRESHLSHRAAQDSMPLRDAFSVLFFVAVGMLFDPSILWHEPLKVLIVVAIIIIGKSLAAFLLVVALRYPVNTALTVAASLAQIGEFSFILLTLGKNLGLVSDTAQNLVLAGAIISISINHFVFRAVSPIQNLLKKRTSLYDWLERSTDGLSELPDSVSSSSLTNHTIVLGYGNLGKILTDKLKAQDIKYVVADNDREIIENLRKDNINAVAGDAIDPALLIQAHISRAKNLIIALPNNLHLQKIVEIAKMLNPDVNIIVRAKDLQEYDFLIEKNIAQIVQADVSLTQNIISLINQYKVEEH